MRIVNNSLLFYLFMAFFGVVQSEVDPPNFNFTLENLNPFQPGQPLDQLEKLMGPGVAMKKGEKFSTLKFYVSQLRFRFPVFVQGDGEKVLDFFAALPSYFLHDVFLQALINKYGKQDETHSLEGKTIYFWNNENDVKYVYAATCTLTCFPLYFTGMAVYDPLALPNYRPLLDEMAGQKTLERN